MAIVWLKIGWIASSNGKGTNSETSSKIHPIIIIKADFFKGPVDLITILIFKERNRINIRIIIYICCFRNTRSSGRRARR